MPVDATLWRNAYDQLPNNLPCPRCLSGQLKVSDEPLVTREPAHSVNQHNMDDWDPDWIEQAFTSILTCDVTSCGEKVAVSGRVKVSEEPTFDETGYPDGSEYINWLYVKSMHPAPPLFPIVKSIPDPVAKELRLAFALFWTDLSASTSRLRTSLERVLDDQGISKFKPNGTSRLPLFDRITEFEAATQDADSAETMTAMRIVGNLGTHGDEVLRGDYFNLLDVYEASLLEIYEQTSAKLKQKKQALIALKK